MSNDPQSPASAPPAATPAEAVTPSAEWKPEPRQWSWKDLFTAPMLAFKPKCMLIAAATLAVLAGWGKLYTYSIDGLTSTGVYWLLSVAFLAVALLLFSLGATLIAVFLRADLLDDEFLTLSEAFGQFRSRVLPALLVPLFLIVLLAGVNALFLYLPALLASIPFVGSALYGFLYPLSYALAIFAILLAIAVGLSVFVFPSIIAVRKHGWFDNVVDTIEAVGTKPHVLIGCILLVGIMVQVALGIGKTGMSYLDQVARAPLPTTEVATTLDKADSWSNNVRRYMDATPYTGAVTVTTGFGQFAPAIYGVSHSWNDFAYRNGYGSSSDGGYYVYGPGLIAGLWQSLIYLLILGYCLNLFIAGGMLSYLLVREDDYWDDEDLEDLDKLAKELEEEAKREDAATNATVSAPAAPPTEPSPA